MKKEISFTIEGKEEAVKALIKDILNEKPDNITKITLT